MRKFGTAIILCGGKSSRMGFDKSSITIGGKLLVEKIAQQLENIFDEIIMVADNEDKLGYIKYNVVEDYKKGCGPAGGIYTGLNESSSHYVFITACDMPFINIEYIKYMMEIIDESNPDCVITRNGKWIEPLYAFYSKNVIESFRNKIDNNEFKLHKILENHNVYYIDEEQARSFSKDLKIFMNLNYIKDLEILKDAYGKEVDLDGKYKANFNTEI